MYQSAQRNGDREVRIFRGKEIILSESSLVGSGL